MCNNRGFTLLEVLISVAILSIAIVTLLTTHNKSLDMMYTSSMVSRASFAAREIMEQAEIEDFSSLTSGSGQFDENDYNAFSWEKIVSGTSIETLKKVEVVVSWKAGEGTRRFKIVSFISKREA